MRKDEKNVKKLTQLEIDEIIDKAMNLSIISYLVKNELITKKEYEIIRELIKE